MDNCYIGFDTNTECHMEGYMKKKGISQNVLNTDDCESLFWRAEVPTPTESIDNLLFYHHEYVYIKNAQQQYTGKICCDPCQEGQR